MSNPANRNPLPIVAMVVVAFTAWNLTHARYWSACFGATALASALISRYGEESVKPWRNRTLNLLTAVLVALAAIALVSGVR